MIEILSFTLQQVEKDLSLKPGDRDFEKLKRSLVSAIGSFHLERDTKRRGQQDRTQHRASV